MLETTKAAERSATTTAEDTLQRKSRDAGVVSGGHLVAKALKNEGRHHLHPLRRPHHRHL